MDPFLLANNKEFVRIGFDYCKYFFQFFSWSMGCGQETTCYNYLSFENRVKFICKASREPYIISLVSLVVKENYEKLHKIFSKFLVDRSCICAAFLDFLGKSQEIICKLRLLFACLSASWQRLSLTIFA